MRHNKFDFFSIIGIIASLITIGGVFSDNYFIIGGGVIFFLAYTGNFIYRNYVLRLNRLEKNIFVIARNNKFIAQISILVLCCVRTRGWL